eukprot:105369-Rhodomonas_salina.1
MPAASVAHHSRFQQRSPASPAALCVPQCCSGCNRTPACPRHGVTAALRSLSAPVKSRISARRRWGTGKGAQNQSHTPHTECGREDWKFTSSKFSSFHMPRDSSSAFNGFVFLCFKRCSFPFTMLIACTAQPPVG